MPTGNLHQELSGCIADCDECARACSHLVTYCLNLGGAHADASHIRLLLDCAGICRTASEFMSRTSTLHGMVCQVCARICDRCATDCARFDDDQEMASCAAACRKCAESCRAMVQGAA
jgi:hypothetical protein